MDEVTGFYSLIFYKRIIKTKERDNDDESEPLSNANNTESDYSETELRGRKSVKKREVQFFLLSI